MSAELDQHIADLIATAKRRKANAKERLAVIKGDEVRFPSRGPINRHIVGCGRVRCPVHPETTPCDEKGVLRGKAGAVEAWNRRKECE